MDHLQNPMVIGIVVFALVYAYLKWDADQKQKQDPKAERKPVNILIPAMAGALSWFLSSSYRQKNGGSLQKEALSSRVNPNVPYCLQSMTDSVMEMSSVELLQKRNLRLPKTDVFIDLGNF